MPSPLGADPDCDEPYASRHCAAPDARPSDVTSVPLVVYSSRYTRQPYVVSVLVQTPSTLLEHTEE